MPRTVSPNANRPPLESMSARTKAVWVTLAVAMAGVTGMLALLDSGGSLVRGGINLPALASAAGSNSLESIFQTRADESEWKSIVIHHTGAPFGTASSLDESHRRQGLTGLGHHFVIGNGNGLSDGEIHAGYRWLDQLPGAHAAGEHGDWYNHHAIGIVIVGNGDRRAFTDRQMARLMDLVAALSRRYGIPPESVVLHSEIAPTSSPGRFFPAAAFGESLDSLP